MPVRIDSDLVSVLHLRRRRWLGRALLLALWLGAGMAWQIGGYANPCLTPLVLLAGTSILVGTTRGRSLAGVHGRGKKGRVTIAGDAVEVEIGGRMRERFRVADVVSGWTEPAGRTGGEAVVLVTRRGVEVRIGLPERRQGAEVLAAAGVAPDQRAVKIHVRPSGSGADRATRIFGAILAALASAGLFAAVAWLYSESFSKVGGTAYSYYVIGEIACLVLGVAFAAAVWRLVRRLPTTTLSIGADGVVVTRLFSRQLLRRAAIDRPTVDGEGLALHLKGVLVPVRVPASVEAATAAADRIRKALQASPGSDARLDGLDRGGRSPAAWLQELRALGNASRGYRATSIDRADLVAVVKDGAAPAERRIAAAVALSAGGDDEARAALRIAVDTCVDAPLRRAIEQAAEGEMEAEALEEAAAQVRRG